MKLAVILFVILTDTSTGQAERSMRLPNGPAQCVEWAHAEIRAFAASRDDRPLALVTRCSMVRVIDV